MAALLIASSCTRDDPTLPIAPHLDHDDGVMMQAGLHGRLAIRHNCLVVLQPDNGKTAFTPIWNDAADIGRDERGIYVRDRASGAVIRPGDRVAGGGGFIASDPPQATSNTFDPPAEIRDRAWVNRDVSPDLPPACDGAYATFHSFRVMAPGEAQ